MASSGQPESSQSSNPYASGTEDPDTERLSPLQSAAANMAAGGIFLLLLAGGACGLWFGLELFLRLTGRFDPQTPLPSQLDAPLLLLLLVGSLCIVAVSVVLGLKTQARVIEGYRQVRRVEQKRRELSDQVQALRSDLDGKPQ